MCTVLNTNILTTVFEQTYSIYQDTIDKPEPAVDHVWSTGEDVGELAYDIDYVMLSCVNLIRHMPWRKETN